MSDRETKRLKFIGEEPTLFMDVGMLHPGDVVDFPVPPHDDSVDEQTPFEHPLLEDTSDELHRAIDDEIAAEADDYDAKKFAHLVSHGVIKVDDGVEAMTPELAAIVARENAARAAGDEHAAQAAASEAQGSQPTEGSN